MAKVLEEETHLVIEQKIERAFTKLQSSTRFNFYQMAMLDMSVGLKNTLAEATLLTNALEHSEDATLNKEFTTHLNQLLFNMNTLINGNISYYNDIYLSKELDFVKLLKKSVQLFSHSFEQNAISITNDIDSHIVIMANSKELTSFTLRLIESILSFEANKCRITLENATLILEIDANQRDEELLREFRKEYEPKYVSKLFNAKIEKLEIKSI